MQKKTNVLKIRLTDTQREEIKCKSAQFGTMSNYVLKAIKEFSNISVGEKLVTAKRLAELYVSMDAHLAHIGGNINQAMKRVNERRIAGIEYDSILITKLLPELDNCMTLCNEIRKEIKEVTKHHV